MTEHKSIAAALAAAQSEMGKALKESNNPHFRNKYADLGNVMDACMPALSKNGIALIQPTGEDEGGRYVETVLLHTSGESLRCRVPLIVSKNDMQGYGSAVTYARRYGLMAMAGIAPEDDDGNAAAIAPPAPRQQPAPDHSQAPKQTQKPQGQGASAKAKTLADDMIGAAKKHGAQAVTSHANFQRDIAWLEESAPDEFNRVQAVLDPPRDLSAELQDEIPY